MSERLDPVLAYHQATKHHIHRFARGPGHLDWATQLHPFRRYRGRPCFPWSTSLVANLPPAKLPALLGTSRPVPWIATVCLSGSSTAWLS